MPDFPTLLAKGGHMREFMRTAPNGGEWVDVICDDLLDSLKDPVLELMYRYGYAAAQCWVMPDNRVQLNVRKEKQGFSVYYGEGDTYESARDAAIESFWAEKKTVYGEQWYTRKRYG